MPEAAAFRILDGAFSLGIRAFDTAEAYGSSAERLRMWIDDRGHADSLEVITKFTVGSQVQSAVALKKSANSALSRFKGVRRLTVLSHGQVGANLWPALLAASARMNATAGQSVYSSAEVRAACDLPDIEKVQAPGNVFDKRALLARGARAVSLDLRSVYLQGVLLEDPNSAELRAPGSGKLSAVVRKAAAALGVAVAPLLIASMVRIMAPRDRVVIGVDDVSELDALPKAFELSGSTVDQFRDQIDAVVTDKSLEAVLDPRQWPKSPSE